MSVKVIEKNAGEKIPFTESGYKLNFDDMLAIKCNKYQKDWPVHKDICMDADGDLTMGTGDGLFYVAEVDIPAKEYEEQQPPGSRGPGRGRHSPGGKTAGHEPGYSDVVGTGKSGCR